MNAWSLSSGLGPAPPNYTKAHVQCKKRESNPRILLGRQTGFRNLFPAWGLKFSAPRVNAWRYDPFPFVKPSRRGHHRGGSSSQRTSVCQFVVQPYLSSFTQHVLRESNPCHPALEAGMFPVSTKHAVKSEGIEPSMSEDGWFTATGAHLAAQRQHEGCYKCTRRALNVYAALPKGLEPSSTD
jgi:hypothetical protein